ncbi:hypothetical protein DY000_02015880 [Brassica cretica]|uniref:Uncharacterized protein n=1 Tax=Brassica cretica TaxID=69181 RepID=A0ABQ7D6Y7_BRACR|nr:hypothetical protein DY000_02015880 [Brassica cretica]
MVVTIVLIQEAIGNMHDQDGHLRNAVGQKIDDQGALSTLIHPNPYALRSRISIDILSQLPKIDVARLNALRYPSQPSETIADNFSQQPDDAPESMQEENLKEKEGKGCGCSSERPRKLNMTYIGSSIRALSFLVRCVTQVHQSAYYQGNDKPSMSEDRAFKIFVTFVDYSTRNSGGIIRNLEVHIAEYEIEYEVSIDSWTYTSIDSAIQPMTDNHPRLWIDSSYANETFSLPEHCYPSFPVNTQPQTSIDYHYGDAISRQGGYSIEKIIKYRGLTMDDRGVLHTSLADQKATSIDSNIKPSIDALTHRIPRNFLDTHNRVEDPPSIDKADARLIDEQATYIKAEVDELVADINRSMRTIDDYHSKRLDEIYYPFENNNSRLTTRTDEMTQDIAMIKEQYAQEMDTIQRQLNFKAEQSPSIDRRTLLSIDSDRTSLCGKQDISESTYVRLRMHQCSINNLQNRMHVKEVDKEIPKNQWTRGDEAIRSFIGTWFQISKEDVDTCFPTSSHPPPY